MESPLLTLFLLACCILATLASPKVRHFKWEVGYIYWSADCEERLMIGINGQYPGPNVRAKAGDTIVVEVKNSLPTEGLSIHWHGIRQLGTPWYDGTASISQCAINPDESFVYRFKVDKAGTYMYHGHYGMQRAAGLYGSLIVDVAEGEEEVFHYDGELSLLLSDWWHASVLDQMAGLSSRPFRWIGEPQTLLINGRGQYNCSLAAHLTAGANSCEIKSQQCEPVVLPVLPNKTYRLRIASITSLASLNLAIGDHKMTVVEADGNYVEPFTVDDMDIYSVDEMKGPPATYMSMMRSLTAIRTISSNLIMHTNHSLQSLHNLQSSGRCWLRRANVVCAGTMSSVAWLSTSHRVRFGDANVLLGWRVHG